MEVDRVDSTKLLLVTANVGSIFEDPEHMLKIWLKEFLASVRDLEPGMLAIHCQEVGGKNYEASMQHVNQFVKAMLGSDELQKYDRARIFLDEDYTAADKFTALGNLYFIHECVEEVSIYDFIECKFLPVEGREVLSGNIENIQIKEKSKYPQNFFPDFKWSRKGFLRTRWNINNSLFDLINIHLFHDASNIVALQKSPSVYCDNRYRALAHTLQRFETDQFEKVPYFIFGDFNFRLDIQSVLKDLTEKTEVNEIRGKKNQISKLTYTDANSKVVLTVESKYFDHHEKHNEVFRNKDRMLNKYDKELEMYKDRVFEFDFTFPPSYPFSEDVSDGLSYMKTRCPSWCDRILLSHTTAPILVNNEKHRPKYDIIGSDVCMGDHKPVYLLLWLRKGKGNQQAPFDTQTSFERRKKLSKKISINGETIDFQKGKINIHDYANFEKSEELIPEFRLSIKTKQGSSLKRQHNISGDSAENSRDAQGVTKKPSFHEIAQRVLLMESALMKWPNRPRTRHHSSSSEDLMDSDEETNQADREPDQDSVHTDVSDLPADTEDLKFELSHSSPSSECGDVKRNAVSKKAIKNENNSKLHLRKTVSNTEQALFEKNQSDLHEKCSVEHEHEIKKMSSGKQESVSRLKSRCPHCVVL
ncbi:inositol polyphosphate-5-phosphatase A-like isoform X1 [Mya arenaria]|uniref:inositol polyphosphate-5-phosphatase A-like isoform X1 n=1 Tax=Mya arenaria TaxID=6604 RepID=UPI0022E8E36C|nr:inositol polyphosphate-5-phosphatase A-like isoform X1 [Mya arenaria]